MHESKEENQPLFCVIKMFVYVIDKDGNEKEFCVSEKLMKAEKFKAGDKVAEEREGVLISLETSKGKE